MPRNLIPWILESDGFCCLGLSGVLDLRPTGGQLAIDADVPIELVSRSMRHASTLTTERYYCRARADRAFARVNDAFNSVFAREPAIAEKDH
jgi:integrase